MQFVCLVLLMALTSCALWKEIEEKVDLPGSGKPRTQQTTISSEAENSQTALQPVKIIDETWIKSENQLSEFVVMKMSNDQVFSFFYFLQEELNYKTGHSVEVTMDSSKSVYEIEATKNPRILRFKDSGKLLKDLHDKKIFEIEILTASRVKKHYKFEITDLVKKF